MIDALDKVIDWLRCPLCEQGFSRNGRQLTCSSGHCVDIARQGYVNLLGRQQPANADTAEMVKARSSFLGAGWYAPVTDAVRDALQGARSVVEVGAGTAHHLAGALPEDAFGLATDVSVPAARRAARAHPRVAAVVADTWAGLPLRDGCTDTVLCVFAPRNPAEFRRVLAPGGRAVVITPEPDHLAELRGANGLLEVEHDKTRRLRETFSDFTLLHEDVVTAPLDLDARSAATLVAMGPNAFHTRGTVQPVPTHLSVRLHVLGA